MKIKDARAVVTGGASGLGLAVARHVCAHGGKVVLLDVQEGPGRSAAAALGSNAHFVRCDVTSEMEVIAAMDAAAAHLGHLNLLVNCAGVVGAGRVLGKNGPMAGEFFTKVIHINLIGTFLCDKAAAALMQHNPPGTDGERGLLIHTSSVAAFEGQIGQIAYTASKAGVVGLTICAARDLASLLVRVCTIAPGTFDTPLLGRLDERVRQSLVEAIPHPRRLGQPQEFAQLACHIVENQMLNGETIRLDGALRMAPR